MKSVFRASFLACTLALAAGCSSVDLEPAAHDDSLGPRAQSLQPLSSPTAAYGSEEVDACASVRCAAGTHCEVVATAALCTPDASTNPCAAVLCGPGTTCEVLNGEASCTPLEPESVFCGGFAGIACPGAGSCVDAPGDGCDPANGGADCGGVCACVERVLCIRGFVFDGSPSVCACVPAEPEPDPCALVRCAGGTHCEVVDDAALCAPDEPTNPCAAVLCVTGTTCEVVQGEAVCTPQEPAPEPGPFCGGIAAIECPGSGSCVDAPGDGCDPDNGGADCGGVCVCPIRALCIRGLVFDASPDVCACVADAPEIDACASVRCAAGTHCEVVGEGAICAADEVTSACAAVSCNSGSTCEVVAGEAVCTPNSAPDCHPEE
jgi:hypothetical protein